MIDLLNMSQVDIEQLASRDKLRENLEIQVAQFGEQIEDEHIQPINDIVGEENAIDVLLDLLYLVGARTKDTRYTDKNRDFVKLKAEDVITRLAGSRSMKRLYPDNEVMLFRKASLIVVEMDEIFYDIELFDTFIGDNQFRALPYCVIGFHFTELQEYLPDWQYFTLPLTEDPKDWTQYQSGGYYSSESKCTLNLGEAEQPQEVLDVLNKLQKQRYRIHEQSDIEEYFQYKMTKGMADDEANEFEVQRGVVNTLTSYEQTIQTMRRFEFMFEFKFDFRGRIYNTAYNINLQGDKYQKGMILPCDKNFKD